MARYSMVRTLAKGKRVLDVACGEGYGSYLMAKYWGAAQVTAVDISSEAIEAARHNFAADNITYEVMAAGDLSQKFALGSFDLVISLETIEHLDNPEQFLHEIKKVCTDDATIIISCPNDPAHYQDGQHSNPFHTRTYSAQQFFDMAEGVLGRCKQKFVGAPILGFGNFPLGGVNLTVGATMRSLLDCATINNTPIAVPPDDTITADDASYYIGLWGADGDNTTGATVTLYPTALNSSAQAELAAEVGRLRTEVWELTHTDHPNLVALKAKLQDHEHIQQAGSAEIDALRSQLREQELRASNNEREIESLRARIQEHALREGADQAEIVALKSRIREQSLRLHVLSAENKLAREGVFQLNQKLAASTEALARAHDAEVQARAEITVLNAELTSRLDLPCTTQAELIALTERLTEANTTIANVPWKAVGVYRRIRRFVPNPIARSLRKIVDRSK